MISDFGEAWVDNDNTQDELLIAYHFLCPEATFAKDHIGKPAHVWRLACTLFHILGDKPLFKRHDFFDRTATIAETVSVFGILPQQRWGHGRQEESLPKRTARGNGGPVCTKCIETFLLQ